jgi:hypothetical protein
LQGHGQKSWHAVIRTLAAGNNVAIAYMRTRPHSGATERAAVADRIQVRAHAGPAATGRTLNNTIPDKEASNP